MLEMAFGIFVAPGNNMSLVAKRCEEELALTSDLESDSGKCELGLFVSGTIAKWE